MSRSKWYRRSLVGLLLLAGLGMIAASCGGDTGASTGLAASQQAQATSTPTVAALAQGPILADAELLSTFKSKDPFIQQAVEEPTTTTMAGGPTTSGVSPTTTYRPGTSTTYRPTTTTRYPGTTVTTKPPSTTTTTAPHIHTLKVLSVGEVGGAPAVTFQVDSSVYKDRRVDDVVSSSWGQIKVLDLSVSSKVATLLHGSETLVLSVGQVVYE